MSWIKQLHGHLIYKKHVIGWNLKSEPRKTELGVPKQDKALDIDDALPVSLKEENETTYITNTNGDALFEAPKGNYKLAVSKLSNGKILYKV